MQMKSTKKRMTTTAAAGALLAVAMPAAGASAATPPAATPLAATIPSLQMPAMNFTPPKVGQLSVDIGPTIIGGKVMDPGMHVSTPGTALPPISLPASNWTLPADFTLPSLS
jgi:hypothetical protein